MSADKTIFTLPRLIQALAEECGIDISTSRQLIHEFFALIEEGLCSGRTVRIKGLGTFAIDQSLESKVTFKPDSELADSVNAPFAMFSPTPLDQGFDLSELDDAELSPAISATASSVQSEEAIDAEFVDDAEPTTDTTETEVEIDAEPITDTIETEVVIDAEPTTDTTETEVEIDAEPTTDTTETEVVIDAEPTTETTEIEVVIDAEPTTETAGVETVDDICDEIPDPQENNDQSPNVSSEVIAPRKTSVWAMAGCLIAGLLIGILIGYFMHDNLKPGVATTAVRPTAEKTADTIVVSSAPTTSDTSIVEQEPPQEAQILVNEQAPTAELLDTITRKRFLTTMARAHYGQMNYWVYIYQANPGLGHPDRITPGTVVKIPPLESFRLESDSATLANAHKLVGEIYGRYVKNN